MSLLRVVAPLAASLFFFSALSIAHVFAPNCTSATWQWTFNSLGQNPCTVAAYMMATCHGGEYTLVPLSPGYEYYGPHGDADADLCYCSTVAYSLLSACGACQGQKWIVWSEWVTNCTKILPAPSFPNPVPSGTRVPSWAVLDVTDENDWDANKSHSIGDFSELGPGSIIGPSSILGPSSVSIAPTSSSASPMPYGASPMSSRASPTSSSASPTSSSASPTPPDTRSPTPSPLEGNSSKKKKNQNTVAIAGGVIGGLVGGVVAITLAGVAIFFYLRRSSQAQPAVSLVEQPITRLYNPDDPTTTFPGYQGSPHLRGIPSQVPMWAMSSDNGSRNSLSDMQTSLPQATGYQGHPVA